RFTAMEYALHQSESPDGRLFECAEFSQRVLQLAGAHHDETCDEVLYVLAGSGTATIGEESHELAPGTAVFIARGTAWSAEGDARALSVLVHSPEEAERSRRARTAGRPSLFPSRPR